MRASANLEYAKLVRYVDKTIRKLDYRYIRNGTQRVTEFEIEAPCHFRVIVEDQTQERFGFGILKSEKNESTIEVLPVLDTTDPEELLKNSLSAFIEELRKAMPREPWKGFGPLRSRAEKVKWSELARLRRV
jgi:hypothetical protein